MAKPMFDQDALIAMFETATAKQSTQLRQAVTQATLQALQGRELTLKNIRGALKSVTEAASMGAAKNAGLDPVDLLDKAVAGMDDAMLKAVDAHRAALQQLTSQGADLREKTLKKALDDLEKFEDMMFATVRKAAEGAGSPVAGAWDQVLEKMQAGGTLSGAKAATTAEQMIEQMQSMSRSSRAAGLRAAQALADSYTAMVSGVLIGMAEALKPPAAGDAAAAAEARKASRK
jgi:hypothetical protein